MRLMSPGSSVGASGQKEDGKEKANTRTGQKEILSKPKNGNESPLVLYETTPKRERAASEMSAFVRMETLHLQKRV
jgi:hypothetical protein